MVSSDFDVVISMSFDSHLKPSEARAQFLNIFNTKIKHDRINVKITKTIMLIVTFSTTIYYKASELCFKIKNRE